MELSEKTRALEAPYAELLDRLHREAGALSDEEFAVYRAAAKTLLPETRDPEAAPRPEGFFDRDLDTLNSALAAEGLAPVNEAVRRHLVTLQLSLAAGEALLEALNEENDDPEDPCVLQPVGRHKFDEGLVVQSITDDLKAAMDAAAAKLTPGERRVYDGLLNGPGRFAESCAALPDGFLSRSAEELNGYFGLTGGERITEGVRLALECTWRYLMALEEFFIQDTLDDPPHVRHAFDAEAPDLPALYDELSERLEAQLAELSDAEAEVYGVIAETISPEGEEDLPVDYPEGFFEQTVGALNEHFGGSGSRRITRKIRAALLTCWQMNAVCEDFFAEHPERPEAEEPEEE